ncbi:hypothetical protein Aph01nite_20730 [Acrocarpospora phusangensis]|uniref:Uncharacterized protein n=1 Tax=Acrocarpospora phusangensis TaxID=1070424 RepID=A0A919UMX5_9ACTN|nr:hypothetical protein [Acrocarpospora phusangensis]GIH23763.1 hypothetical protein Aph01nite_20730 [Acrocarpospora phusangensis]
MTYPREKTFTEENLSAVLASRGAAGAASEPDLNAIKRRAGGIRRRRWAIAVAAASVLVLGVTLPVLRSPEPTVAVPGPAKADVLPLPEYEGLPLLASETATQTGTKVTLRFRPASEQTKIVLRCERPMSIAYAIERHRGGVSSAGGVCGPDGARSRYDDKAFEEEWTTREHVVTFWVFPPDAPVLRDSTAQRDCREAVCDGKYRLSPSTVDDLARAVGKQPGAWSVAVYDQR